MKALGQRYVQSINRTYRRNGTLWEDRDKLCSTQNLPFSLPALNRTESCVRKPGATSSRL